MTADLAEPLIIAAVPPLPSLSAAYNVLVDSRHRLYRAYVEGVASLPGWLLTDDETVAVLTCRPGTAAATGPVMPTLGADTSLCPHQGQPAPAPD